MIRNNDSVGKYFVILVLVKIDPCSCINIIVDFNPGMVT